MGVPPAAGGSLRRTRTCSPACARNSIVPTPSKPPARQMRSARRADAPRPPASAPPSPRPPSGVQRCTVQSRIPKTHTVPSASATTWTSTWRAAVSRRSRNTRSSPNQGRPPDGAASKAGASPASSRGAECEPTVARRRLDDHRIAEPRRVPRRASHVPTASPLHGTTSTPASSASRFAAILSPNRGDAPPGPARRRSIPRSRQRRDEIRVLRDAAPTDPHCIALPLNAASAVDNASTADTRRVVAERPRPSASRTNERAPVVSPNTAIVRIARAVLVVVLGDCVDAAHRRRCPGSRPRVERSRRHQPPALSERCAVRRLGHLHAQREVVPTRRCRGVSGDAIVRYPCIRTRTCPSPSTTSASIVLAAVGVHDRVHGVPFGGTRTSTSTLSRCRGSAMRPGRAAPRSPRFGSTARSAVVPRSRAARPGRWSGGQAAGESPDGPGRRRPRSRRAPGTPARGSRRGRSSSCHRCRRSLRAGTCRHRGVRGGVQRQAHRTGEVHRDVRLVAVRELPAADESAIGDHVAALTPHRRLDAQRCAARSGRT